MGELVVFTGIIERTGEILSMTPFQGGARLEIRAHFETLTLGESIAIDGVCLTLTKVLGTNMTFDISPETLCLTTLGDLKPGCFVNLERAMPANGRFSGHYVSGHVDMRARLFSKETVGDFIIIKIDGFLEEHQPYLIPKGSIALDGVSLTINRVEGFLVECMLVPHTLEKTTLYHKPIFSKFNVEFDYFARVVLHQYASNRLKAEVE